MSDLTQFILRVECLEEEIRALQADRTAVYAEAKAAGFDPKIMRKVVAERRMKEAERLEQEALMDTYRHELGMLADMPLGTAALKAAKNDGRAAPRVAGNSAASESSADDVPTRPVVNPASPDPTPLERAIDTAEKVDALARTIRPGGSVTLEGPETAFTIRKDDAGVVHLDTQPRSTMPDIPRFLDRRERAPQTEIEEFTGARR